MNVAAELRAFSEDKVFQRVLVDPSGAPSEYVKVSVNVRIRADYVRSVG